MLLIPRLHPTKNGPNGYFIQQINLRVNIVNVLGEKIKKQY